ncbi:MAG TPA: hypothetical protein VFE46_13000 [Pirellulales bacterium]|jgi:hypothetical protein|nr:hypothetical protein [Pirellulales bacterium]
MENQPAREQLIAELKRHKLPRAYIQRLLAEWDDHLVDLQDERSTDMDSSENTGTSTYKAATADDASYKAATGGRAADHKAGDGIAAPSNILNFQQRLGDPAQLAAFAAQQYRNRSFLGRHPIFTFVALPLPLAMLLVTAIFFATYFIGQGLIWIFQGGADDSAATFAFYNQHPLLINLLMAVVAWIWTILPPLVLALFMCRIARRNARSYRWSLAACLLIAIWAGMFFVQYAGPTRPGNGTVMMGLALYWPINQYVLLSFLPKFLLALAIGLLLIKRAQRLQTIEQQREEDGILRRAA